MKFIKDIKNFVLDRKLKGFGITKYIINEDGSLNCDQDVHLSLILNSIPFLFNRINGYFNIEMCKSITSLKNCPKYISGTFDCSENKLISLEFGPEYVGKSYCCESNKLMTLKGCVDEVYGNFSCESNKLKSLEFCPMQVEGWFNCSDNFLTELDRSPFIRKQLYCYDMFNRQPEFNGHCEILDWNRYPNEDLNRHLER